MTDKITLDSIPEGLKSDKNVTPYIARSLELNAVNPVVSYYCKIYVLEYILSNKLHTTSKDIEIFTIKLLDDTEAIKQNNEDESVQKALNDKSISISLVLSFAYKLFNSCLEDLSQISRSTNRPALVGKFRATLVFLSLLSVFTGDKNADSVIDWEKLTGGKAANAQLFELQNKDKIKVLKFQLSKLIKGEVTYKDEPDDKELEAELDRELQELTGGQSIEQDEEYDDNDKEIKTDPADELALPGAPNLIPGLDNDDQTDLALPGAPKFLPDDEPTVPTFIDDKPDVDGKDEDDDDEGNVTLPGAPHYPPQDSDNNDDIDGGNFKLPGAPKYLPDDDLTHINKSSSIQVFPPDPDRRGSLGSRKASVTSAAPAVSAPPPVANRSSSIASHSHASHHITKANVNAILNKTESIAKIQKHSKFAISALNYEDIETAEKELLDALDLLKKLKLQEDQE
ncbi:Vta1 like-domain-containing protein [Scheffersomyces amazonensis]|uniref:Vta1 like-domain-containing protein n=1 Tax=Scheffersomyces amazonensis TaxID=1078765 RepID=UPI00315CE812